MISVFPEGTEVDLEKWPTHVKRAYKSKKQYHKLLDEQVDELTSLQRLHYASNGYVLVIFQGMGAAGKDGAIRQFMSGVNPQGCQVFSFKQPAPRSSNTIFFGEPRVACRTADESASSIAPTTRVDRCRSC